MPKLKRQSKSQRIGANRSQSREDGSARSAQDGNLKERKQEVVSQTHGRSLKFSDVGMTCSTDHHHGVSVYVADQMAVTASEPGSHNFSDVGMTCPHVTSECTDEQILKMSENDLTKNMLEMSQINMTNTSCENLFVNAVAPNHQADDIGIENDKSNKFICQTSSTELPSKIQSEYVGASQFQSLHDQHGSADVMYTAIPISEPAEISLCSVTSEPVNAVNLSFGSFHQNDNMFDNEKNNHPTKIQQSDSDLCKMCGKYFSRKHTMDCHVCAPAGVSFTCDKCKKMYKSKAYLTKHKCCYCSVCSDIFSSFYKKKIHKCKKETHITSNEGVINKLVHTSEQMENEEMNQVTSNEGVINKRVCNSEQIENEEINPVTSSEHVINKLEHKSVQMEIQETNPATSDACVINKLIHNSEQLQNEAMISVSSSECVINKLFHNTEQMENEELDHVTTNKGVINKLVHTSEQMENEEMNRVTSVEGVINTLVHNSEQMEKEEMNHSKSNEGAIHKLVHNIEQIEHEEMECAENIEQVQNEEKRGRESSSAIRSILISRPLYNPQFVSLRIGNAADFIADDVIIAAIQLLRSMDVNNRFIIGDFGAAAQQIALSEPHAQYFLQDDTIAINIILLHQHWFTIVFYPGIRQIYVYDSKRHDNRPEQVLPLLRQMYGNITLQDIVYPRVTQQPTTDHACGAFAVAFATSFIFGKAPENETYFPHRMREHLRLCILRKQLSPFPTRDNVMRAQPTLGNSSQRVNQTSSTKSSTVTHGLLLKTNEKSTQGRTTCQAKLTISSSMKSHGSYKPKTAVERKQKSRMNAAIRQNETARDKELKCQKRSDPRFRHAERKLDNVARKSKRTDEEYRSTERKSETAGRKSKRNDAEYRSSERKPETAGRKSKRKDAEYRSSEKKLDNVARKSKRKDAEYRSSEKKLDNVARKSKRKDAEYRYSEKKLDNVARKSKRKDAEYRSSEKKLDNVARKSKRNDAEYRDRENQQNLQRKEDQQKLKLATMEKTVQHFRAAIHIGCNYICTCCCQLWFRESVIPARNINTASEPLRTSSFNNKISFDGHEWMCNTCALSIKKKKMPTLATANLLKFPHKPKELYLNPLEERLVSPINTFMQMRELPRGGQHGITGNVVNVPADTLTCVTSLPRHVDDSGTIPVKLKRRLRYKSHVMYQNIRPHKCLDATKILLTKELYKTYVLNGIDNSWISKHIPDMRKTEWSALIHSDENKKDERDTCSTNCETKLDSNEDSDDAWSEMDETEHTNDPADLLDTMLQDNIPSTESNKCFSVAPSEGNQPITSSTANLEELAFPSIFCGEKRPSNSERQIPVKYSEIVKSELRRDDRRAAMSVSNIFFKAKKLQNKQIQDKVWLALKRVKSKGSTITAGNMKDAAKVEKLVRLDEGYRIFRTLRGSPPYWEAAKHDLFAMVRQLGLPTWFISLSAAETRWKELLQSLGQLIDNIEYSEADVNELNWETKSRLISSDPITTARYFDHRVQAFFRLFLKSPAAPIGKVRDFFYRTEFQQRGSPHIHAIVWVEDAPVYKKDPVSVIEQFIDQIVTTEKSDDVENLIKLQTHRHSHTCRKKKEKICRFNFPLPPMRSTRLLQPLTVDDVLPHEIKLYKENWYRVADVLQANSQGMDISFDDFLQLLNLTDEAYLLSPRSVLKDVRVFLKRDPTAIRVNGFNKHMLQAWEANIDIQYVTDPFACAMYVIQYVSKGQKGMSELMRMACDEAKQGDSTICQQVRTIGNKFLRHVEICAQEAAYLDLQLPMKRASRTVSFINTSPEDERPFILKDADMLESLPDDSEDVKCGNKIQRYTLRPETHENTCLADFEASFDTISKPKCKPKHKPVKQTEELPESDYDENLDDNPDEDDQCNSNKNRIRLMNGSYMRIRKQKKVIRYRRYCVKKEPENYYREMLMLFSQWRSEDRIIGSCSTYEERYMEVQAEVEEKKSEYEQKAEELDEAEELLNNMDEDSETKDLPTRQTTLHDDVEGEDLFKNYDIGQDLGVPGSDSMEETIRNRLSDEDFRGLVRSLNRKQMEIFYHILHTAKASDKQQFIFLSGGAGVGKTRVLKAVYQALVRHYNTAEGEHPESVRVLLAAPTGKAAYLIKGSTLHAAFNIPANQGFQYKNLTHEALNSIRCRYRHLKVVCIDEISMCGANMFNYINLRLHDITGIQAPFGGVHVICIGDLFQLQPVLDSWLFKNPSVSYSALAPNVWQENFKLFELTDIMRQREDRSFAQLLNRMREGLQTKEDITMLKSRIISISDQNYPVLSTHIMYYNKDVQEHNCCMYTASTGDKVTIEAVDIVIGDIQESVKQKIKEKAPIDRSKAMGLGKFVRTAVGLHNEMTVNVDTSDGLVNGAACVTKRFQYLPGNPVPAIIWFEFDDPNVGSKLRAESRHLYGSSTETTWTPIKAITREFPVGRYKNAKILRRQFPIVLTAAKTVHRCQGDTLQSAVIQLPNRATQHLHYVAFSRVSNLDQVHIVGDIIAEKITVSKDVKQEMTRLRTQATLQLSYVPIYSLNHNSFRICFHNAQSLHLHSMDMQADFNFCESQVNMFVETRLCSADPDVLVEIPGYQMYRNDFSLHRTAYGSILYARDDVQCSVSKLNLDNIEITFANIASPVNMSVISIYCRPKETLTNIHTAISHLGTYLSDRCDVVIMGDFNIDADPTSHAYRSILRKMEDLHCRQLLSVPTTNGHTTIDHIYTTLNEQCLQYGTLESYYSYHKPIWLALDMPQLSPA